MKTETFQKASDIIKRIHLISDNIDAMEKNTTVITYFCSAGDIVLNDIQTRHRQEVMEIYRTKKAELEKELADL